MTQYICVILIHNVLSNDAHPFLKKDMKKGQIVVVDDDEDVLITARMILRNHFESVHTLNSPKTLESFLKANDIDIIILDMNFQTGATTGNEGLFWLRKIRELDDNIHVIMNTAYGDIQLAVECMKEGAIDFLVKPWEKEKLLTTAINVRSIKESKKKIDHLDNTRMTLESDIQKEMGALVGQSKAMKKVYETIKKVATTDANVLITGENGTGKELVARAIHQLSKRSKKNFIKVDLGSLSETLFESELFGHNKGAFTDAKNDRMGRIEIANEGSLFLDEIGNVEAKQQASLLSVLQNRQVTRVGSNKPVDVDIRLICATNKDIEGMVDREEFRQDLLYRINTVELDLPPLRDRDGDIEILANHFLKEYAKKYDKPINKIADDAWDRLNSYPWPGNVRELQHSVERAVIMSDGETLTADDFMIKEKKGPTATAATSLNVEDIEKEAILKAIEKHNGNLTSAAKTLGFGRSTLYRKMTKYGIEQ
ncbi:sigma-54 dependent transcriptional regulator [Fulvivirga sp.]|uniref:sigma-54-dependent transcriptional regulator n=1 Tax=Fulvivirga sp. TaxID=1931237 RepID=UPI0032ED0BF9